MFFCFFSVSPIYCEFDLMNSLCLTHLFKHLNCDFSQCQLCKVREDKKLFIEYTPLNHCELETRRESVSCSKMKKKCSYQRVQIFIYDYQKMIL